MPDRKQIPGLPEATALADNDFFVKRDAASGTDQKIAASLIADKTLELGEVTTSTGTQTLAGALDRRGPVFDSVADMKAASGLTVGIKVRTLGYYTPGDGGGNDYEIVAAGTGSNYGFLFEQLTASGYEAKLLGGGIMEDKTVYIPSDYATLQDAIDDLSKLRVSQGVTIDLMIEAGHQPASGISVANGDYGHFRVAAQDIVVTLPSGFSSQSFIEANRAHAPVLGCLVSAGGNCSNGYLVLDGGQGVVLSGCGVTNVQSTGLRADNGSRISARESVFSNAAMSGVGSGILSWGSQIDAEKSDVSNSGHYGAQAAASGTLNFREGNADNATRHGIRATNAGLVNARSASAQNCGTTGIRAYDGSTVHAQNSNVSGSAVGFWAEFGSTLNAREATANNTTSNAIYATDNSRVDFYSGVATGLSSTVIASFSGSTVSARFCTVETSAASCYRVISANILANNSTATTTSDLALSAVVRCEYGGTISCQEATLDAGPSANLVLCRASVALINDATVSYEASPINFLDGATVNVKNTSVEESEIFGNFNTLSGRGIVFG